MCKRCNGNGSRPACRKCGRLPALTVEQEAAAVAAFRALPQYPPLQSTHTISDVSGRIIIKEV